MQTKRKSLSTFVSVLLVILGLVLSACAAPPATAAPTQDISMVQTQSAQTVIADVTQNAPPSATATEAFIGPTPNPSVPMAVVPTAVPNGPSAVAKANTSIYSGPGTDYVLYGTFAWNQSAIVLGKSEDGKWWAISVPIAPTGAGWVSAGWVNVTNVSSVAVLPTPPLPETTEMVPPDPTDPQATALANTYIRSGPAANYPAYGIVSAGATGRVIGRSEDGQWWVVRLNPQNVGVGYGWVMAQYVQTANTADVQIIQNPTTYTTAPPVPPASGAPSATTTDYVNVRTGPGTNYPVLVVAPPSTTGEVTGKSSDGAWYQVKVPAQYSSTGLGWVSASYVIPQNTSSVPVVVAPPPPTVPATPPPSASGSCAVVSQSPTDGTTFNVGTSFTTTWVLKNTGSSKWSTGEVDLRYLGASNNVQIHTGSDLYDLSTTVQPGQTYNFSVPMIAPYSAGTYGETWEVGSGSKTICQFYVYINVTGNAPAVTPSPTVPASPTLQPPTLPPPSPTAEIAQPIATLPTETATP